MFDFTIRQLEVFLRVSDEGGFRRAADAMGVSEAAISDHIRSLEDQLGTVLFTRRRGAAVELSVAGRELQSEARAFTEHGRRIGTMFRRGHKQTVRLYVGEHLLQDCLRPALPSFLADHPDIQFDFVPFRSRSEVMRAFALGEIDGVVISIAAGDELRGSTLTSTVGSGIYANAVLAKRAEAHGLQSLAYLGASYDSGVQHTDEQALKCLGIENPTIARRYPCHDVGVKLAINGEGAVLMMDSIVLAFDPNGDLKKLLPAMEFERRFLLSTRISQADRNSIHKFLMSALAYVPHC